MKEYEGEISKMKLKSDPKKIGITGMVFYEDI